MAEAGLIERRMPFQADARLRREINAGRVMFTDQHLSETVEEVRCGNLPPIDIAVVEAAAIHEDGSLVLTTSVGNTASFVEQARKVVVELNLAMPLALEGLHDIYTPGARPAREPIPLTSVSQRIGAPVLRVDPERIAAIVITGSAGSPSGNLPPYAETPATAGHGVQFL